MGINGGVPANRAGRLGVVVALCALPMIMTPVATSASGPAPAATPGRPLSQTPNVTHGKTHLPQRTVQPGQGPGPLPGDHPAPIVIGPTGGNAPATVVPTAPRRPAGQPAGPPAGGNIGTAAIPFVAPAVPEPERKKFLRQQPEAPRP